MIGIKYFCKRIIEIGKHVMHTFDWMLVFTIILAFTITSDTSQSMVMADCLETLQKMASMPQEWSEWL